MAYVVCDKRNTKPPYVVAFGSEKLWTPIFFEDKDKAEQICKSFNMLNMKREEKYVVVEE